MDSQQDSIVVQLKLPRSLVFQLDKYLETQSPESKAVLPTPYEWAKTTQEGRQFFQRLGSKEFSQVSNKEMNRLLKEARDKALGVLPRIGRPPLSNLREEFFTKCMQSIVIVSAEREEDQNLYVQSHDSRMDMQSMDMQSMDMQSMDMQSMDMQSIAA